MSMLMVYRRDDRFWICGVCFRASRALLDVSRRNNHTPSRIAHVHQLWGQPSPRRVASLVGTWCRPSTRCPYMAYPDAGT